MRRAAWAKLAALLVALSLAFMPIADAFCAIDLPMPDPAAAIGTSDGLETPSPDDHHPDPCCEDFPSALVASDHEACDLAAGSARILDYPLPPAPSVFQPSFPPYARARRRLDSPPSPEPPFRRYKRLLI